MQCSMKKTIIELAEKYIGKDYADEIKELYDHMHRLEDDLNNAEYEIEDLKDEIDSCFQLSNLWLT